MEIRKFPKCYLYSKGFGPGWWLQPEPIPTLWSRLVPPTGTKGLFSPAQRAGSRGLWSRLVAPTGTKGGALVPVGATNRDQRPCAARGQKLSPTSLVERGSEWFISSTAAALSSSSQMQAYGPNVTLCCLLAYWAFCGPESWPRLGF